MKYPQRDYFLIWRKVRELALVVISKLLAMPNGNLFPAKLSGISFCTYGAIVIVGAGQVKKKKKKVE